MIWIIVAVLVVIILFRFFSSLNEDNNDLQGQSLSKKFRFTVNDLNQAAFNGHGKITVLDKRHFNLYEDGQNQIISFHYSTGQLTITWKYKYYQKEVVHEKQFNDVRNLSIFEQQKISKIMIQEMEQIVARHQNSVLEASNIEPPVSNSFPLEGFKTKMRTDLRDSLDQALRDAKELPEMMHGIIVMQAAASFCEGLKGHYMDFKNELEYMNQDIGLSEFEYKEIIDEITSEVLSEYVE